MLEHDGSLRDETDAVVSRPVHAVTLRLALRLTGFDLLVSSRGLLSCPERKATRTSASAAQTAMATIASVPAAESEAPWAWVMCAGLATAGLATTRTVSATTARAMAVAGLYGGSPAASSPGEGDSDHAATVAPGRASS